MVVSNIKAWLPRNIQTVWDVVTSMENVSWRSDLDSVEVISKDCFIERVKGGYATMFMVTAKDPCKRWEFDMENDNMKGHWTGVFTERDGQTEIDFTEEVFAKKLIMRPFVKAYLKRQQALYLADLKKALSAPN